jgi:L-histidine N-alpha-methyltransferase
MEDARHEGSERRVGELGEALAGPTNTLLRWAPEADGALAFARSVAEGLACTPPRLECRYLYDARGSALYGRICEQPEYYLTRTEDAILARHAAELPEQTGPVTLVELGSGDSAKTDRLLSAYLAQGALLGYVPVDVSEHALQGVLERLGRALPGARIAAVHGSYAQGLAALRAVARPLVVFLGSTIGNLFDDERRAFWLALRRALPPRGFVLLGVDLVKDARLLEAAYDDAAGVTRAFTLNLFARMNRELGAGLELDALRFDASWSAALGRIEIHVELSRGQRLRLGPLGHAIELRQGERILVEISRKFELGGLREELARAGFRVPCVWTDPRDWFATLLLQRKEDGADG